MPSSLHAVVRVDNALQKRENSCPQPSKRADYTLRHSRELRQLLMLPWHYNSGKTQGPLAVTPTLGMHVVSHATNTLHQTGNCTDCVSSLIPTLQKLLIRPRTQKLRFPLRQPPDARALCLHYKPIVVVPAAPSQPADACPHPLKGKCCVPCRNKTVQAPLMKSSHYNVGDLQRLLAYAGALRLHDKPSTVLLASFTLRKHKPTAQQTHGRLSLAESDNSKAPHVALLRQCRAPISNPPYPYALRPDKRRAAMLLCV